MPRTVSVRRLSAGVVTVKRPPTARWCFLAHPSSRIAPSAPSRGERGARAVLPLEVEDLADRRRIDGVDALGLAVGPHGVLADRRRGAHARARPPPCARRRRRPATSRHRRRARAWRRRASPASPWSSPSGPAAMIVSAATSATPMVSAEAVMAVRPGARMALRRASMAAGPPVACTGRPRAPTTARTMRAGRRSRREVPAASRSASTGATRVARHAGTRPATSVTSTPTSSETTIVREAKTVPVCGRSSPSALNSALMPLASPKPAASPTALAAGAHGQRLGHDRAQHLAPRGAGEAQQPELARALGDHDRQRVEDRERPDQQRDAAEAQQHALDDRDEPLQPVEGEAVLLGRGLDLGLRQRRGQVATHLRRGHAAGAPRRGSSPRARPCRTGPARRAGRRPRCVAVPSESTEPNVVMPVTRKLRAGPAVAMRALSPMCRCCLSAVPASMTTSPGPLAQRALLQAEGRELARRGPPRGPGRRRTTGRRRRPCRPCPGSWSRGR